MDGAAAREPDGERVVVGVAERDDPALALPRQDLQRGLHDRALDTAARDRSRDLAGVAHGHRGARIARARTFGADDARDRDPVPGGPPAFDVVQHFFHDRRHHLARHSVRARRAEWPSTNASTYGSAAAIPCASGA